MYAFLDQVQNHLWIVAGLSLLLATAAKYVYRLTLHPLAKFPGPKLAGATSLYGAFFDLRGSSSYVRSFPSLHNEYGPIVRAWPNHLHFRDMEVYNQIFKIGSRFDKSAEFYAIPPLQGGFFPDPNRDTALPRRNMLAPSFNRDAVRRAEPRIVHCVSKFLDKLNQYAQTRRPVNMSRGFMCLMADGVMNYIYQKPFGALGAEDFQSDLLVPVVDFHEMMQWPTYFPRGCGGLFKSCKDQIHLLKSAPPGKARPASVFDTTLAPNPEKGQITPSVHDLTADAFTFTMAGTDTSATTLVVGLFNLLHGSPHMLERLKEEVRGAIPDNKTMVHWANLEKLPYLRAVIKESLRLGYGVPGRIPRVVPREGATFLGHKIPGGTVVSSACYIHHMNPSIFPYPEEFRPERWLDADPKLEQYLVSFSRGSRGCIGMNLAYCVIHLTLAHLLRRYDLELFETTQEDMEWKDCFVPVRRGPLKVLLKAVKE